MEGETRGRRHMQLQHALRETYLGIAT